MLTSIGLASILAFAAGLLLTPVVAKLSTKLRIVDDPDPNRKFHQQSIPLVGGLTILCSLMVVLVVWHTWIGFDRVKEVGPLLAGLSVIVIVGLVDDRFALRSRQKLIGQFIAVGCVVVGGVSFAQLSLFGFRLDLGVLEIPILSLLLLSSINAFNLLDGSDGFASSTGIVTAITLCVLALVTGQQLDAVVAISLASALSAFLCFNFPPARVFLGDSGSMLIGMLVGILALRTRVGPEGTAPLGVVLACLAVPFLDMGAAILRRVLTGRSIATPDRAHLHHCLSRRGFGPKRLVLAAMALCLIPMIGVGSFVMTQQFTSLWLGIMCLGIVLVGSRSFGGNELRLVSKRAVTTLRPFFRHAQGSQTSGGRQTRIGLEDSKDFEHLWQNLVRFAIHHRLTNVRFHLSGSWMDDGFDVFREKKIPSNTADNWKTKLPIYSGDRLFGEVQLSGSIAGSSGQSILKPLAELLDQSKPQIDRLFVDVARRSLMRQLNQKDRVLFINRSYWPDCEATGQLLTELCEDLASEFDVSVMAGQPNHQIEKELFCARGSQVRNNVEIFRIRHTTFPKRSMLGKALNLVTFSVAAMWNVLWVPRHEVVVVETDPFLLAFVGAVHKRLRGGKLIIYLQDIYPDVATAIGKINPHGWVAKTTHRLMQRALRYADEVIVLGEDMKQRMVNHGVHAQKITLVPNWIDTTVVHPIKQQNQFRFEHGLDDKFVVMHSGNMGLTQELDCVIEAAQSLRHRSDVVFVFVGDGASRPRLESTVQRLQLENVMFLPYQPREELAISLSAADLHLISMHPNTVGCLNPSKLYGIMAAGTPVLAITPEESDIWKTVTSERIGVAARPGDVSNIKAAIECCASGEVDLEAMGRRARNLVELRYDRKHGCERFSRVIDKYVKRHNVSSLLSTRRDEDRHALVGPHSDGKTSHRVTTPHLNVEAIDSNVSNTTG